MTSSKDFDVESVLSQLTLDEKISLIAGIDFWHTAAVPRLDIPSLRFSDGPNGLRGTRFFNSVPAACLPCGTGLAATWDKDILYQAGELMATEAYSKGVHVILGPTMNIQRGPLGGRGFESFSEDSYLAGKAAASIIKGIESKGIASTPKHFVCNDLEHERESSNTVVTPRALNEIYLEPFRIAMEEGKPTCLMTAYNKVNGVHVSQDGTLLNDKVRDEWGWNGCIMSDWYGTYTSKEAIEGGLDIEMPGPTAFRNYREIGHMIRTRELHINDLNDRVRNVLNLVKHAKKTGIPENGEESTKNNTKETSEFLRKLASDTVVLLKNKNELLPLKKSEKIAVIGPNAKVASYCGGGSAALNAYYTTTPFDSISKKLDYRPDYSVGCYSHKYLPGAGEQVKNGDSTGFDMKFYLEPPTESKRTLIDQYSISLSSHHLVDYYNDKLPKDRLFYIDFEAYFTPEESGEYEFGLAVVGTAQLFVNDKLVVDNKSKQTKGTSFFNCGTIEERGTIDLKQGKKYKVRVEFGSAPTYTLYEKGGEYFGGGIRIGLAKVINEEEEIKKSVELAKSNDKVILCIGLNGDFESESFDRSHMKLEGLQDKLVEEVLKANPNTIIVNQSGTPVEFPWLNEANGLIHAWYGGNEGGNAIADVIFGDANPNGKLSLTFPKKLQDTPTYLNFRTEKGRVLYGEDIFVGYKYYEKMERDVAFPFGFGLSYTKFEIKNLKVTSSESELSVSVNVENVGKVDGAEVVQVYISNDNGDENVIRPIKELKGFEKVYLKSGEKKTIDLKLRVKDSVAFFDEYENKWSVEAGEYHVLVGDSSDNITLKESFNVEKSYLW
ncbi:unnamed protein product [Candida verbasci]|uniref:beta-glucosidase n=1 Tax=Candida verbasci TaxID=1227364 RepID=A0A9W4TXN2_9ASCO|nr:unnamed protein product [Candida verbasci]